MKKIYLFPLLVLWVACMTWIGCEQDLNVPAKSVKPALTLLGKFSPDQPAYIQVFGGSEDPLKPAKPIAAARVSIYQNDVFLQDLLRMKKGESTWYSDPNWVPAAGVRYTFRVDATGYDAVEASDIVPAMGILRSIETQNLSTRYRNNSSVLVYDFDLKVKFSDASPGADFYHLIIRQRILKYDPLDREKQGAVVAVDDVLLQFPSLGNNNVYTSDLDGGLLFDDSQFNGKTIQYSIPFSFAIEADYASLGATVVELRTVSRAYYEFYKAISRQVVSIGLPFNEPGVIPGNVIGGFGVVGGYHVSSDSLLVNR